MQIHDIFFHQMLVLYQDVKGGLCQQDRKSYTSAYH